MAVIENSLGSVADLLREVPVALVLSDDRGIILEINEAAQRLLVCTSPDLEGKQIGELLPGLATKDLAVTATQHSCEDVAMQCNGRHLRVKHTLGRINTDDGQGYLHVLWDVSDQIRSEVALKESSKRILAILETIPNALITTDNDGNIETFNLAAEPLFQYTAEEVIGRHIGILLPDLDTNTHIIASASSNLKARRKNGAEFPAELAVGEMNLAGQQMLACVVRDISDRVRAEQEAHDAREQLMEAEKLASLGELVAGVAHEVNTPVGISVTSASHLREQYQNLAREYDSGSLKRPTLESFLEACDEATRILETNLRRASELIQSFKQVAVDRSSSERRLFNIREYLDELLLSLRPQIKRTPHSLTIQCDPNLLVNSYPGALSQILTNFIMNSLIHGLSGKEKGQIEIQVKELDQELELVYSDNGRGIPQDLKNRIFEPFFTTRRGSGSSGLGLHIVYNLVRQTLQGTIRCETEQDAGTKFIIRFPKNENR